MILPKCNKHRQPAGWRCTVCKSLLCPDCVAIKSVNYSTRFEVCLPCGEMVEPLTRHRSEERSYGARLPGALIWPFTSTLLFVIGGVALVRAVLSYSGLGWVIGGAVFAAVCLSLIRTSARGIEDAETLGTGDLMGDVFIPGFKALVAAAIVWVPMLMWIVSKHSLTGGALPILKDPVVWLLLLVGVLYAPMAVLVAAAGGSVLEMLSPPHVVVNAQRLGASYLLAVGALAALFVPWFVMIGVGSMLNALPIPFIPRVLDYALACYVPFVAVRVLGLLLYTHGDRVGFGVEPDYRVRLLPLAEPRGLLPEAAPAPQYQRPTSIELEPEPALAPDFAPRQRPTELDPAALPPLKVEDEDA